MWVSVPILTGYQWERNAGSMLIRTGNYGPKLPDGRHPHEHPDRNYNINPGTIYVWIRSNRPKTPMSHKYQWFHVPPGHLAAFNAGAELAPMIDYLIETYGADYPWLNELV